MNAIEQLDEYLNEDIEKAVRKSVPELAAENSVPFQVDATEKAIWAMRKISTIDQGIEEIDKAADAEVERVNTWRAEEIKRISSQRSFFEGLLEGYHRRIMADNPKQKTIKLPHGQLQIRAQQPEFVRDDKKIIEWADKEMPAVITREPKLDWGTLKDSLKIVENMAMTSQGEVIPGITVVPRGDKFSVKLAGV